MKSLLLAASVTILKAFWFPQASLLLCMVIAIVLDFATGVIKACITGVVRNSDGFRKTVIKFSQYGFAIGVCILLQNVADNNGLVKPAEILTWLNDGLVVFIIYIECTSIFENLYECDKRSMISKYFIKPMLSLLTFQIKNNPLANVKNNTPLILIAAAIASMAMGCGHTKKLKSETTSTTQLQQDTNKQVNNATKETFIEKKDSTIGVPARVVVQVLNPQDIEASYLANGVQVPRTHTKKGNGVTSSLTRNVDGSITANCECDSITLVVQNLLKERILIKDSLAQYKFINKLYNREKGQTVIDEKQAFFFPTWQVILALLFMLLGCVLWMFVKSKIS